MRSFFSHIIFAALAVVAAGSYFHWENIQSRVGSEVCKYEVLGRYGSSQPIALGDAAKNSAKTAETSAAPAVSNSSSDDRSAGSAAITEKKTVIEPAAAEKTTGNENSGAADENKASLEAGNPVAKAAMDAKKAEPEADKPVAKAKKSAADSNTEIAAVVSMPKTAPKTEQPREVTKPAEPLAEKDVLTFDERAMKKAWLEARRQYWAGDEKAIQSYVELVEKYPDQADIRGELGNVYIKAGMQKKAAEQFLQAGLSFNRATRRNEDKIASIMKLLRDIDPASAEKLRQAVSAADKV